MNDRQRMALEQLRKRRMPGAMPATGGMNAMNTDDYGFDMPGAGY